MKKTKWILKRIIIAYLIFYITLSSASTCFARGYDAACGEYLAEYAKDFIETYGSNSKYGGPNHNEGVAEKEVDWGGGSFGQGTFWCCCTSGVNYMYEQALGVRIYDIGFNAWASSNLTITDNYGQYWESLPISQSLPGDIIVKSGHVEMALIAGATTRGNFGSTSAGGSCKIRTEGVGDFQIAIRLKSSVDVDPSGTVRGSSTSNINYSKFFFNGVPDGKYSLATRSFWQVIIDTLAQIIDFIVNLVLYIIRAVFVGYTAIMENLLSWFVNLVSDTNTEDTSLDISSTEASTSDSDTKITVEKILFNELEIFDINVFSRD